MPAAFGRLCVETLKKTTSPHRQAQPPSGGCVLKREAANNMPQFFAQPPSGGCVLKPDTSTAMTTAAIQPPSGGCVLKQYCEAYDAVVPEPAAFGRLCVETRRQNHGKHVDRTSRLRAAVC